jgi:hypothetical protein
VSSEHVQVSAGARHTMALTQQGAVFCFGNDEFAQASCHASLTQSHQHGAHALCVYLCACTHARVRARMHVCVCARAHANARMLTRHMYVCAAARVYGLPVSHTAAASLLGHVQCGGAARNGIRTSPYRISNLPDLPVLFVVAFGDSSLAVMREALPEEPAGQGSFPDRLHQHLLPYRPPSVLGCAAAAIASKDPRSVRDVLQAIDEVFLCPGYLLAGFSASPVASTSGRDDQVPSPPLQHPEVLHGLDVDRWAFPGPSTALGDGVVGLQASHRCACVYRCLGSARPQLLSLFAFAAQSVGTCHA